MTRISFEQSIHIQRPLAFVYSYLADFSKTVEWDPTVVQAQKSTPGPIQVGTHFDIQIKFGWTQISLNYHITELKKDQYIELKGIADTFSIVDRIRFEGDDRQCTVHYAIEVDYQNALAHLAPLLAPLIRANGKNALLGLQKTLAGAASDWQANIWTKVGDRLVLPGLLRFTRLGYTLSKSRFTGVSADLSDQTIVITGATSGIGAATARSLAQLGAKLIIVARNAKKAQAFVDRLEQEGLARPRIEIADLSLMADVMALAERLLDRGEAIDVLINNAGALFNQRVVTAEGIEQSFATLLLSPYILTEILYPLLRKAGSARVINVSSGGMYTQALQIDDLESEQDDYNGSRAYARAKRGLVDLSEVWAKAWQKDGITVHAMHPGWADTPAVLDSLPKFYEVTKPWLRTPEQGADTVVWLAAAAEAGASTGLFWLDRTPHSTAIFPGTKSSPATQASLKAKLESYRQRLSQQDKKNKE